MQLEVDRRIQLVVNGARLDTGAHTLAELVLELGFAEGAVATARNGDFVPRAQRSAAALAPGDTVEIVAPRQGG
jgi:sulfur carrier protein